MDIYGKAKNRFPLLVSFAHPVDWVVTLPSIDVNGEDGTIQAGEYAKGDTATLFVYADKGNVQVSGVAAVHTETEASVCVCVCVCVLWSWRI